MGEKLGADVNPLIPVVEGSTPEIAQPYIWLAALPGRSLTLCIRYVVSRLGGEGMLLRPFGADGAGDDVVRCDGGGRSVDMENYVNTLSCDGGTEG